MNLLNGKVVSTGLTFDDVLLIPQRSELLTYYVFLKTKLTRGIELNIPIISSAMDTVTESRLAIALAHQGGVGFIHKNMSIEEQAEEVRRVKLYQNGMISDPVTLSGDITIAEANDKCKHYKVSGFPVVDENGVLTGIITNRDMKYRVDQSVKVCDVMTKRDKLITARVGITLDEAKEILMQHRIEKLPIINKEGTLCGLITIKDIDKTMSYPNSCKDNQGRLRCGAAVGISEDTLARVSALVEAGVDVITVDSAHGHSLGVINTVRQIKETFPNLQVIGGNI
ncbi:MAG: IMP dehydrogenase, partial [Turicibacter sp.]|nr:IMP dehydrogenase [Turicibacter sp.]